MKINYPSTQGGWTKLGEEISNKSKKLGGEPPINKADADVAKVGTLATEAKSHFSEATRLSKDAENLTQKGTKALTELENEIRRVGKVLSGRYRNNLKGMGQWGFTVDETTYSETKTGTPVA